MTVNTNLKNTPVIRHYIDNKAWLYPEIISWHSNVQYVSVIFNADRDVRFCGKQLKTKYVDVLKEAGLLFGTACGQHVVLMKSDKAIRTEDQMKLVASHEAFHQAVQYNGINPRLDVLDTPEALNSSQVFDIKKFNDEFMFLLQKKSNNNQVMCDLFKKQFNLLDKQTKYYFLYKAYWEWPAEYYMRISVLAGVDFEKYKQIRKNISTIDEANPLYISGVLAMHMIEQHISRTEWQRRYIDGETPIDILMDIYDCESIQGSSLQVSMKLDKVFEN